MERSSMASPLVTHLVSDCESGKRNADDFSIIDSSRMIPAKLRKIECDVGNEYPARIGVIRLDGWGNVRTTRTGHDLRGASKRMKKVAYVPLVGDVDDARSFLYPAFATVAEGCSWEVLKDPASWENKDFIEDIKTKVKIAFRKLVAQEVKVITANCGLFMWLHSKGVVNPALDDVMKEMGDHAVRPMVSLSTLNMLPYTLPLYGLLPYGIEQGFKSEALVVVFTSNEVACIGIIEATPQLKGYKCFTHEQAKGNETLKNEGGILVIGLNGDNVIGINGKMKGFECVNDGTAVYYDVLQPGIQIIAEAVKKEYPNTRLVIVECTEVSAYSDTIRDVMKVPVYDPISLVHTMLDSFVPHRYQQISHKERTTYIRTVLRSPVDSMEFEITFLPTVISEAERKLAEEIACISSEESSLSEGL